MKLIRLGEPGQEKPGIENNDGSRWDMSSHFEDYDQAFFEKGGLEQLSSLLDKKKTKVRPIGTETRIGPPIARPSKIVCVGLNYKKHAQESGMEIPKEPVLFFKSTTALSGPFDPIKLPRGGSKTDWEVELAVVIGKKASYVNREDAMDHIAGYMVHNDISERSFQLEREGQWVKGKSCDTFAPIGPYLVTKEAIPNPHNLNIWLRRNGKTMQSSTTADMIFDIPELISYISGFMTLLPGDIISTGTPYGVGMGLCPPTYLEDGDILELGIDNLGIAKQRVIV